jgi:hypothetical protein
VSILDEAQKAVENRREIYGHSTAHHELTANLWSAYLGRDISATEVAVMMILDKIARQRNRPNYRDNYADMAGYAACAAVNAGVDK